MNKKPGFCGWLRGGLKVWLKILSDSATISFLIGIILIVGSLALAPMLEPIIGVWLSHLFLLANFIGGILLILYAVYLGDMEE